MELEIGPEAQLARVAVLSEDGTRMIIEFSGGGWSSVDCPDGGTWDQDWDFERGSVLLVDRAGSTIVPVPNEAWPTSGPSDRDGIYVAVVRIIKEDITIVDAGAGSWRTIPTSDTPYKVGNTVQVSDAVGVQRVLDEKPLRFIDSHESDEEALAPFKRAPSAELTFDDFGGLPEIKRRAQELIQVPLDCEEELAHIRARPIKGVLFTGLPGTGKTMLARIIASNSGATFYEVSGPTIFSKYYGESEELLRRIFEDAARQKRAIIFFDEIDSVAGQRNEDAHEASKRVVAQLLTLMDGFKPQDRVVVIAASNRPKDIDAALRRPGRFDWELNFPLPNLFDRDEMLRVAAGRLTTLGPLPFAWLAAQTERWSAAELAGIWREAALLAVTDDRRKVIMAEDCIGGYYRVATQRQRVQVELEETPVA